MALNNNNNKIKLRPCTSSIREERDKMKLFLLLSIYPSRSSLIFNDKNNNNNKNNSAKNRNSSWLILCFLSTLAYRQRLFNSSKGKRKNPFTCLCMDGYRAEWIVFVISFISQIKHHLVEPIICARFDEINESIVFIYLFVCLFVLE